ncbi:MAG: glucose 1-dehydrogenase [Cyclobacteriaceae bacterium]|nr:glucose 1-dehydrogenase [Cyclobacteriaceae bacterium]
MFRLDQKTAIVTGGASGIGLAIARVLGAQGCHVYLFDLHEEACKQAAEQIIRSGGRCTSLVVNVSDQKAVQEAVGSIMDREKTLDILVNSAGIAHIGKVENTTEADLDRIYQVNIKGTYNLLHVVVPVMKAQHHGAIVNIASVAALVGISDRFAYSMSKGAVLSMTQSVARDYVKDGIRCNSISPARVHTPFVDGFLQKNYPGREKEMFEKLSATQPVGRMAQPDEVAHLALYLVSDEASFVTGCDYPIDGGFVFLNN